MYYQMIIRKAIIVLVTLLSIGLLLKLLIDHFWRLTYNDPFGYYV
jgi:hypothetical protein